MKKTKIGRLHVLTDQTIQSRYTHAELARLAIKGGADTIQLRDKNVSAGELIKTARAVGEVCRRAGVLFVVNDRADVALAAGADGVHLGQNDLPVQAARKLLGDGMIIGGSASTIDQAVATERMGADYVGFGHIYATESKVKNGFPKGPDMLRDVQAALGIPVIAIGGIDLDNIDAVVKTGAWGIAVIGAVCAQDDPALATRRLRSRIDAALVD
ncbi:MAG: thiamine phosphate synthase [Candidatus Latescibacterota bacterium]|nr:MAG: thiamine phosphate synthase [Candidatus Latescibacterota bacterium]